MLKQQFLIKKLTKLATHVIITKQNNMQLQKFLQVFNSIPKILNCNKIICKAVSNILNIANHRNMVQLKEPDQLKRPNHSIKLCFHLVLKPEW